MSGMFTTLTEWFAVLCLNNLGLVQTGQTNKQLVQSALSACSSSVMMCSLAGTGSLKYNLGHRGHLVHRQPYSCRIRQPS